MKQLKSSITVFLALILVCVFALVLTLVESARTAGLRYHLESSADSALNSLFSEYHNGLWDRYRIFAYDCPDTDAAMNSVAKYMQPYLEVKSWMHLDAVSARLNYASSLTDDAGEWLEREIVDFMSFAVAESLLKPDEPEKLGHLQDELKESKAMKEITEDYAEQSQKAIKLEEALTDIDSSLRKQQKRKGTAVSALRRGSNASFQSSADVMIREMERLARDGESGTSSLISGYESASHELEIQLAGIDAQNSALYENIVSEEGGEIVNSIKTDFSEYSNQESLRRADAEAVRTQTLDNIEAVKAAKESADRLEELEEELSDIEDPDERRLQRAEIKSMWRSLSESFDSLNIPSLGCEFGVKNEEEKGFLESAAELLSAELLSLVLPEGKAVSAARLDLEDSPGKAGTGAPRDAHDPGITERVLLTEYIGRYFTEFTDPQTGAAAYEMEYICAGLGSDKENLSKAVGEVFAIREGMNYLAIVRDEAKRGAARTLAEEIVLGASGGTLPILVPVVECLIIGVWAGAESVIDVRALLSGNRVSLMKSDAGWKLDLKSILDWGESKSLIGSESGDECGIAYEGYLKFILMLVDGVKRNYRMMDIMQMNLRRSDPGFRMKDCIYGMDITVTAQASHLFTALPLTGGETSALAKNFTLQTEAAKAY